MRLAYALADRRAIANDGETRREPERNKERQPDDDTPEDDGVVEVRERENGSVVPDSPQRPERGRIDEQPVADAIEERIEHEADRHAQPARGRYGGKRYVQDGEEHEHEEILRVRDRRQPQRRPARDAEPDLGRRALGMQSLG